MIKEIATLYHKITDAFRQDTPFVSYRKPYSNSVSLLTQNDTNLYTVTSFLQSGFVFVPFNDSKKSILFPQNKSNLTQFNYSYNQNIYTNSEPIISKATSFEKEKHLNLVEKGVHFIKKNAISKIVLSRKETLELTNFDKIVTYKNLLQNYKSAFVYMWYHPKVGLWLGATPETLLTINNNIFKTMALAGTQSYNGTLEVIWEEKEKQEQQFVSDYILNCLKELDINCTITKPYTIKAASIIHLCSDISGRLIDSKKLDSLIKNLHPTPAVCGLPKETAKQFILENEDYNREFYTGFLGELNFDVDKRQNQKNKRNIENHAYNFTQKQSSLFVNLRCMQIKNHNALLYIGGGITKDSNPEKEYLETVAKAEVMKNIL